MPKHKHKKKHVTYHGLHHPHVLRHVFVYHNWFENCIPRADDHDGDDNDTPADPPPSDAGSGDAPTI